MKKFFIVLCGIFVIGNAFGSSRSPEVNENYLTEWKVGEPYDTNVEDVFTKKEYLKNRQGTYGDGEGAIVAFVAREIYKNGGRFCATQIQAANENFNDHSWIDYYKNSFTCMTVCKPGYIGDTCDDVLSSSNEPSCNSTDFTKNTFAKSILDKIKTSGKDGGRITETDMQVFSHQPGFGLGEDRNAWDIVLGVVEVKTHGLVVAPIRIQARRTGTWPWYRSYIVNVYSNDKKTLLCADGYIESNGDCVKSSQCQTVEQFNKMCTGYTKAEYKEDQHTLKQGSCGTYFRCADNKGFKDTNDKECIECPGGVLAYVDSEGLCKTCEIGQIVNDDKNGCDKDGKVKGFGKSEMFKQGDKECWLETDPRKFAGCVHGCTQSNGGTCWDKQNKGCVSCD